MKEKSSNQEREIKKDWEKRGWWCIRAGGSLGALDVVCMRKPLTFFTVDSNPMPILNPHNHSKCSEVIGIQHKAHARLITKHEVANLLKWKKDTNGTVLVAWPKGRRKKKYEDKYHYHELNFKHPIPNTISKGK